MDFDHTSELLSRLARLIAADGHDQRLRPVQWQAMRFLAMANRFSRTPRGLTAWLGQTKGSVSQTINALVRKGLVSRGGDDTDRRVVRLTLTDAGERLVQSAQPVASEVLNALDENEREQFGKLIDKSLRATLETRGGAPFGICAECRHLEWAKDGMLRCALLDTQLFDTDTDKICLEQVAA